MEKAWQNIQLKKHTMISNSKDVLVAELGRQSLKLPLCWRVSRLEATWFIDLCEKREAKNHLLLDLP